MGATFHMAPGAPKKMVHPLKTNEFVPWKSMVGSDVFPTEMVTF